MRRHRSTVLGGALLVAYAGILGSLAHGAGSSALHLDLSSINTGPVAFRLVIANSSDHEVAGGNLCLTFYAGDELYALGNPESPVEFRLGAGQSRVEVLRPSALVFSGPLGQRRPTDVVSRLSHSRWSVVASVLDDSAPGRAAVTVRSNELAFSPGVVLQAKQ